MILCQRNIQEYSLSFYGTIERYDMPTNIEGQSDIVTNQTNCENILCQKVFNNTCTTAVKYHRGSYGIIGVSTNVSASAPFMKIILQTRY